MYQFRDGLFEAMAHRYAIDPTMCAWGEENRDWGGAFAVYRGLTELLPYRRLFNSPISEAAIVGAGVGYALSGGRAVVELMYCDFLGRAGDEVFNQMAKWQSMSAGLLKMPLVLRVSVGNKYGAQHSQDWSALVAHIPGLKVYFPATPTDAKGMLNLALAGTDPVVFLESQLLYDMGEQFEADGVPEGYYETPEGEPVVRREGTDVTIATLGATLYRALEAADILQEKYGISAEVIDLRFVAPLNYEPVVESVKKTGRLVLASDAVDPRLVPADRGHRRAEPGLRRPGRPGGRGRCPQPHHARPRAGGPVLPAAGVDRRRHPRADPAAARSRPDVPTSPTARLVRRTRLGV